MKAAPSRVRRALYQLRVEMMGYIDRSEDDTDFCGQCHLPLPEIMNPTSSAHGAACPSTVGSRGRTRHAVSSSTSGALPTRFSAVSVVGNTSNHRGIHSSSARIAARLLQTRMN